jgi:hypothetical protein
MNSTSPIPFGSSAMAPFGSPMHQQSDNEDMADEAVVANAPQSNLSFGTPVQVWSAPPALSPIPETTEVPEVSLSSPERDEAPAPVDKGEEKLAQLRAKIEEKKRFLEERKRREQATNASSSLNVDAAPFVPGGGTSTGSSFRPSTKSSTRISAEASKEFLPEDLRAKAEESTSNDEALRVSSRERDTLNNAVSLVGTCQYMCPDEELLRRERESDIQLLEIPRPVDLHPKDWTYRNTVVKRFRRSAADYKLDVPEWVRPPQVLERVCSYLEEWVMVRKYNILY